MIAIALSCQPQLLIADEPTTALDVTTEAQVLRLIKDLQQELGMALVFITHNLGVVAEMADEVAVMYLGRVVEYTDVASLFAAPKHPYTQALLQSIPRIGQKTGERLQVVPGSVPHPQNIPTGCPFHPRCHKRIPGLCDKQEPQIVDPCRRPSGALPALRRGDVRPQCGTGEGRAPCCKPVSPS